MKSIFRLSLIAVFLATILTWSNFSCIEKINPEAGRPPEPSEELTISEDITLARWHQVGLDLLIEELGRSLPQGRWPSTSYLNENGVHCSDLFYLDTNESIHVIVSSDTDMYGYPFQTASNKGPRSRIWIDVVIIRMLDQPTSDEASVSSWRSEGYSNSNYRQIGTTFKGSFDFSAPERGFYTVILKSEDEFKSHNCHIEIRKSSDQ